MLSELDSTELVSYSLKERRGKEMVYPAGETAG
jgi:hypothetical protein